MSLIKNILRTLILSFFLYVAQVSQVSAQEQPTPEEPIEQQNMEQDFAVRMNSVYTVNKEGSTIVEHQITITNKKPTIYLKQYTFSTSFSDIANIVVLQGETPLPTNSSATKEGTTIGIVFADEVVGQGKSRNFTIRYSSEDIADIHGAVLELHIPQITDPEQFSSLTTTVYTPVYFSKPTYITVQPNSSEFVDSQAKMVFEGASAQPIAAFFGSEQVYSLSLQYNLENTGSAPILTQISLPPDTQFQKMHIHSLEPKPEHVKTDADGNWIATYRVPAASVTVVSLEAQARLTLEPNTEVIPAQPTKTHLDSKKYWEVDNRFIQTKALELGTAAAIHSFVVDTLEYPEGSTEELLSLSRLGAATALQGDGTGICQEYADSFVALARAANIPARRLIGYAYANDSARKPTSFDGDILHAWAEYHDPATGVWKQVDPTWQDTTGGADYFTQFDLSHIVFAINGHSSSLPNPAGSYKLSDAETKDVVVSIGTNFPTAQKTVVATLEPRTIASIPIPGLYTIAAENQSEQALYGLNVSITPIQQGDAVLSDHAHTLERLIPFEKHQQDIHVYNTSTTVPTRQDAQLRITQNDIVLYEAIIPITTGPEWLAVLERPELPTYLAAGLGGAAALTWGILVFRRSRKRFVRR